jgi:hypothetical protein
MDDDEVVDAEIVDAEIVDDDDDGGNDTSGPAHLLPADTILAPCHHGCTCGLHQQTVYGDRVPRHEPTDLDHGEMGLLVKAVGDATRMLNGFHDHFRKLRAATVQSHGQAKRALRDLTGALNGEAVRRACAERDRVDQTYADLTPDERQPAPRWLKAVAVIALAGMVIFDAYFFQQIFLDILNLGPNDPWWKRDIGLIAAVVMAIGVIAAGRILAGPVWRIRRRWRRPGSPDDPPPSRTVRAARVLAVGAAPAAIFFVLGWWASFRGQAAVHDQLLTLHYNVGPVIPSSLGVMLLLLSLALTVVVLEILAHNPYHAQLKRSERVLARARRQITSQADAAARAVEAHEIAWRDLRSARDEVISFVRTELARPWQDVILPARLRHGRAGPKSAAAEYGVKIELAPDGANGNGAVGVEQVQISYQIFDGMAQPQPGPGPLAEVVRAVLELNPEVLKQELVRLEGLLHAQLGSHPEGTGPAGADVTGDSDTTRHHDEDEGR